MVPSVPAVTSILVPAGASVKFEFVVILNLTSVAAALMNPYVDTCWTTVTIIMTLPGGWSFPWFTLVE